MTRICEFAESFYLQNMRFPSTTEIANEVGIARGTAYKYLVAMDERGIIKYDGKSIETEVTQKADNDLVNVGIIGSISCGEPICAEENIENYVSLPSAIFGNEELYILRANGESMIDAGIDSGDLVVVKNQTNAKDGDIVVALVDNENTLKRIHFDQKHRQVILHPENKTMSDIIVPECVIQGVVKFIIKKA